MAAHLHAILRAMLRCRLTLHPGAVPRLTPHMRRPPPLPRPPTHHASFFMPARGLAATTSKKKDAAAAIGGTPLPTPPGAAAVAAKGGSDGKKAEAAAAAAKKTVTATKKGAAVLDPHIPDDMKESWHVLQLDDEIYDATLNQTNVGANNNKFFIIQALESNDGGSFRVYCRYGRVGSRGRTELLGPIPRHEAIRVFKFKFWHKTNNQWSNRKNFRCHSKKYTWLEMDYGRCDEETKKEFVANQETKLETRTAHSISVVRDISMMKQQMMETGYDANKLPLGKISKSTILKGYDILKRISNAISKADSHRIQLEQLSGEFYTVIPHNFGFKKMRKFIIDTPEKLKAKLEMVEALGKIEIATRLLDGDSND